MSARRARCWPWLALVATACALEPGVGVRTWQPHVELAVEIAAGRHADGGWLKLDNDYQIRLDEAVWTAPALVLDAAAAREGEGGGSFDPANPPPGYSLCHGGHCHADDGRLVDYEEIEAELAAGGGTASFAAVARATLPDVDLLTGVAAAAACVPDCGLPETTIARVRLSGDGLRWLGRVRDGRTPPRFAGEVAWSYESPAPPTAARAVQISIALDDPATLPMAAAVRLEPALLDGLDWDDLVAAAPEAIELHASAAAETIAARLAQLDLELTVPAP